MEKNAKEQIGTLAKQFKLKVEENFNYLTKEIAVPKNVEGEARVFDTETLTKAINDGQRHFLFFEKATNDELLFLLALSMEVEPSLQDCLKAADIYSRVAIENQQTTRIQKLLPERASLPSVSEDMKVMAPHFIALLELE